MHLKPISLSQEPIEDNRPLSPINLLTDKKELYK